MLNGTIGRCDLFVPKSSLRVAAVGNSPAGLRMVSASVRGMSPRPLGSLLSSLLTPRRGVVLGLDPTPVVGRVGYHELSELIRTPRQRAEWLVPRCELLAWSSGVSLAQEAVPPRWTEGTKRHGSRCISCCTWGHVDIGDRYSYWTAAPLLVVHSFKRPASAARPALPGESDRL
jgi:hypothetical protein